MPILCSLTDRPRVLGNLNSPALAQTHEDRAQRGLQAVLEHLQQQLPNVQLLHGAFDDQRRGWASKEGLHINTSKARLDTPFHEYSEVITALAEQHDSSLLDHARQQLVGTLAHDEIARAYPVSDDYTLQEQLTETLNHLIGESASQKFQRREQRAQTVVGQVLQAAQDFLQKLTRQAFPLNLRTATLADTIDYLSEQLLTGPSRPDVDSAVLHDLFKDVAGGTRDQQVVAELPTTANDFLEQITGKSIGKSNYNLGREADERLGAKQNQGDSFTLVDEASGQPVTQKYTDPSNSYQRKLDIIKALRERSANEAGSLTSRAVSFFALDDEARATRAQQGEGENAQQQAADQSLHQELGKLFPDFLSELGDKVVTYSADNAALLGSAYNSALDNGTQVVHLYERVVNGQKVKRVKLASLTKAALTEQAQDRPLLSGLYNPEGRRTSTGSLQGWLQKTASGIKLSGSTGNLYKLHTTLLAMHFKQQGFDVEGVSVVKLSPGKAGENQVLTYSPTEHLAALQSIAQMPRAVERLQAQQSSNEGARTLLGILQDSTLYDPQLYVRDWLSTLETHLAGVNEQTYEQVQAAVGDYRAKADAQSARTLLDQLEARQQYLVDNLGEKQVLQSAEYRMLADTVAQLYQVKTDLNPYQIADTLERWTQSFLGQTNPFFRFVFNRWDDLRKSVKSEFERYKDEDRIITEAMLTSVRGPLGNRVAGSDSKYFDLLREKQSFDYFNHKTQQWESKEVVLPKFIQPDSPDKAWQKLNPQQQAYITYKQRVIAEMAKRQYRAGNTSTGGYVIKQETVDKWYEESYWAKGWLPMARASVSNQLYAGNVREAGSNLFQNFLEENNAWELDDNKNRHELSKSFALQNGKLSGKYGNSFTQKLLGLELRPDYINEQTGQAEERYQLTSDYLNKQAQLEGDLRKGFDLYVMSALKHDVMRGMENYLLTGRILMRQKEDELGIFARASNLSAEERASMSPDEKLLVDAFQKLFLHRNNQLTGENARNAAKALKALGVVTRHAVLAGNFFTPLRSNFATFVGRVLPQALVNFDGVSGIRIQDLPWALSTLSSPANYGKLYALGQKLSILRTDENDLLNERVVSGKQAQVIGDLSHHFMAADKLLDNKIRLLLMLMQMRKDKTWGVYSYDNTKPELSQRLKYDEAKHRELVGEAEVNAIRDDQVLNGQLKSGEKMSGAYTGTQLRAMEQVAEDILGGYTDATATLIDTNPITASFTQFRKYFTPRLTGAFGKQRLDANRGSWITGPDGKKQWVEGYEVGMWQSFLKLASTAAVQPGGSLLNPRSYVRAWQGQNAAEKRNNRLLAANLVLTAALYSLARGLAGDDDDEQQQKRQGLLDAAIGETFIISQVQQGYGIAGQTSPSIALLGKAGKAALDAVNGDLPQAQRFFSNIGAVKFYNQVADLSGAQAAKK